jgi:hypothetical protein
MANAKYPAFSGLVMQTVKSADFSALNGEQYPVDTSAGTVGLAMPKNGSAAPGAGVAFTYVRSVGNVITSIVPAGGAGYPPFMAMAFTGLGVGADATLVSVAGVPVAVVVHNGGTGWTADPTGVTLSAGARVGDEVGTCDPTFSQSVSNPTTYKAGSGGNILSGRAGGEHLEIIEAGLAIRVNCRAPESALKLGGWTMVA